MGGYGRLLKLFDLEYNSPWLARVMRLKNGVRRLPKIVTGSTMIYKASTLLPEVDPGILCNQHSFASYVDPRVVGSRTTNTYLGSFKMDMAWALSPEVTSNTNTLPRWKETLLGV